MVQRSMCANMAVRRALSSQDDRDHLRSRDTTDPHAISSMGRTSCHPSKEPRLGQQDLPPWRPDGSQVAQCVGLCGSGREGAPLAAGAKTASAVLDPDSPWAWGSGRGLPLAVVYLPMDRRNA